METKTARRGYVAFAIAAGNALALGMLACHAPADSRLDRDGRSAASSALGASAQALRPSAPAMVPVNTAAPVAAVPANVAAFDIARDRVSADAAALARPLAPPSQLAAAPGELSPALTPPAPIPPTPASPPSTAPRFVPPLPAEIAEGAGIIVDAELALVLGKALFWDQQVGSDGQACASCHFQAGADPRINHQLNPGFLDLTRSASGDTTFGSNRSDTGEVEAGQLPSGTPSAPNVTLAPADFPFHRLQDETDRDSAILTDNNDVVGSVGAFAAVFSEIEADGTERCGTRSADIFHVGGLAARQVEPRNTPTTINAVFNRRQFWDGRANNLFNGVGVFGLRDIEGDPNLRLIIQGESGAPELGYLLLENASLASQAVGPPLNSIEMSCAGRSFADLGRKLLARAPLALQKVDPEDGVLGAYAHVGYKGLDPAYSYAGLIQQAFAPKYWSLPGKFSKRDGVLLPDAAGYTQMESNMSMFWGLSIMLYEASLISDQSEFDSLVSTGDISFPNCVTTDAVDPLLARGCKIFFRAPFGPAPADGIRGVGCTFCHAGTDMFSEAAAQAGVAFPPLLQVGDVNGNVGTRDLGFANIGTRPAFVDVFLGGTDPYGNPLAFAREYREFLDSGGAAPVLDPFLQTAIEAGALVRGPAFNATAKLESDGATKIPTLRNTALTAPYFSYGGYKSLREVMKFYNRGGNRRQIGVENAELEAHGSRCGAGDDSGSGPDGNQRHPVLDPDCNTNTTGLMTPLGLSDCDANGVVSCDVASDDLSAVVRFMQSLTDRRVQCDQAPFDHPELLVTHGHLASDLDQDGSADDRVFAFPPIGAEGYDPSSGFCIPNAGDLFAPGMQGRVGGARVPL
jgi:cytochrome c peroxidase